MINYRDSLLVSGCSNMSSLSERLSSGRLRELATLLLKAEHPSPSRKLVEPLLELVRKRVVCKSGESSVLPQFLF